VNCLGHSPSVMTEAIASQAGRLINCSPPTTTRRCRGWPACSQIVPACAGVLLQQRRGGQRGRDQARAQVGCALPRRRARDHHDGPRLPRPHAGHHGRLRQARVGGALRAQGRRLHQGAAGRPGCGEARDHPRTVGIMLEPIQGEPGCTRRATTSSRGFGRSRGRPGCSSSSTRSRPASGGRAVLRLRARGRRARHPDPGQGLGGGVPLAALLAAEHACCFEHGDQGGTFNGSPLMTAIGSAVVETVSRPAFLADVTAKGEYLADRLRELSATLGHGVVRGGACCSRSSSGARTRPRSRGAPWITACSSTRRGPTPCASCRRSTSPVTRSTGCSPFSSRFSARPRLFDEAVRPREHRWGDREPEPPTLP